MWPKDIDMRTWHYEKPIESDPKIIIIKRNAEEQLHKGIRRLMTRLLYYFDGPVVFIKDYKMVHIKMNTARG